jgi:hypothetical protein
LFKFFKFYLLIKLFKYKYILTLTYILILTIIIITITTNAIMTERIIYQELTIDVCENYENIHNHFFKLSGYKKRKSTFETCALTNSILPRFKKLKIYNDLKTLINDSKELLRINKITNFNEKLFYMEFQRANLPELKNKNKPIRKIPLHFDDYGAILHPVWSIIYYPRKDSGIKGGNFEYRPDFELNETKQINLKSGSILIFPGNIYHSAERMYGFGCRDLILIQFPRTS